MNIILQIKASASIMGKTWWTFCILPDIRLGIINWRCYILNISWLFWGVVICANSKESYDETLIYLHKLKNKV